NVYFYFSLFVSDSSWLEIYTLSLHDALPIFDDPTQEEWLLKLLIKEVEAKEERKIQRLIKQAKFIGHKTLDSFEWHQDIRLQDSQTKDILTSLNFIKENQNIVCIGAPGTGKTHLASDLGYKACQQGIETRFWRVS